MTAKQRFFAWYDRNIVAKWYSSVALWIGVLAGILSTSAPEWIQSLLDNWGIATGAFSMNDATKSHVQAFLLFVALPIAKAWRQQNMSRASLKQAANRGETLPPPAPDSPAAAAASVVDTGPMTEPPKGG